MSDLPEPRTHLDVWVPLATLGALVLVAVPGLGSDPWPFVAAIEPTGVLGPIVRAAGSEWDVDLPRTAAVLAGVLVVIGALVAVRIPRWRVEAAVALTATVVVLLLAPAVLLQVGLREASAPWFHTNDSTYQIEIAGDLVLDGENPYGHDYRFSGMERFYSRDGSVTEETRETQVALRHFAYFPGTPLASAAWRLLPSPFDDYRFLVLLATILCLVAFLAFDAPLAVRLAAGAAIAANPLAIRAAWFGTADAPSLLLVVLSFALVTRSSYIAAGAVLGAAVLLKQFALVAVPFLALMIWTRSSELQTLVRSGAAALVVFAAGVLPFLIADPGALWRDTISYGTDTYRIVSNGLSGLLVRADVVERTGSYPFVWIALAIWLPVTLWLLYAQLRSRALWVGAAGFAVSMYVLLFISRVFQTSYLIWPLAGIAVALVLRAGPARSSGSGSGTSRPASAAADRARTPTRATSP
jgi:hypothetical protein